MTELTAEETELIRESVEEFIEIIGINNSEVPTETTEVVRRSDDGERLVLDTRTVPAPEALVERYKEIGVFDDVVAHLLEEGNYPAERLSVTRNEAVDLPVLQLEAGDRERVEDELRRRLRDVSGLVMKLNDELAFSESAFESALEGRFLPWYRESTPVRVVVPLYGLESLDSPVELEYPEDIVADYTVSETVEDPTYDIEDAATIEVEEVRISDLTDGELTGLYGVKSGRSRGTSPDELAEFKIEITMSSVAAETLAGQIADMVVTTLRLYDPFSEFDVEGIYYHYPDDWLLYEERIPELRALFVPGGGPPAVGEARARLDGDDAAELRTLWDSLFRYLPSKPAEKREALARPIERFNAMYGANDETAIVDCVVALESTLLQGGGRVQEQGTVLLDDDENEPSFVYDSLGTLWELRNDIVRDGQELSARTVDGRQLQPHEMLGYGRYFLSRIIAEYVDLDGDHPEKTIGEINREVIAPRIAARLVGGD